MNIAIEQLNNDIIKAQRELERAVVLNQSKSTYNRKLRVLRELVNAKERILYKEATNETTN
jgi:hypothetical protein